MTIIQEPFFAGQEIGKPYFFDRKNEIATLKRKISSPSPINIALHGQRRIGKSSLLKKLKQEFGCSTEVIPISIKCEKMIPRTPENFARVIINALKKLISKGLAFPPKTEQEMAKEIYKKRLTESVAITDEQSKKTVSKTSNLEFDKNFNIFMDLAFEYAEEIQKHNEMKIVFFMDEFQELFSMGDEFLWSLRSYMSECNCSFVVSSSNHRFFEFLRTKDNPFFNFFSMMEIGGIDDKDAERFIVKRLKIVNKKITAQAINYILKLCEGKPFYIQLLCSTAFDISLREKNKTIDEKIIERAFDEIFKFPPPHMVASFNSLKGVKTKEVFIIMCIFDLSNSSEIAEKVDSTSSQVRQILNQIEKFHGLIKKNKKGEFVVVDKFMKEWIRREYS